MPSGAEIAAAAAASQATRAVETVSKRDTNELSVSAVAGAHNEIQSEIKMAIENTPEMQHVLNTEPFWKKRSFYGALGGGLACAASIASALIQYMSEHTDDDGNLTASMFGAALAAWGGYSSYRAGVATRPLGTSPTQLPYPLNRG